MWVMHTNTECSMSVRQPTWDDMLLSGKLLSHPHWVAAGRCGRTFTAPAAAVQLYKSALSWLQDARGNILDDEALISTLNNSKATSGMQQLEHGVRADTACSSLL